MNQEKLSAWFAGNQKLLEDAYTAEVESWKQSGFSGPQKRWDICRKPIADCINLPGSFLDIGCANGYLLECIINWTASKDLQIQPYGLDNFTKVCEFSKTKTAKIC